jgi:hypothetical protein
MRESPLLGCSPDGPVINQFDRRDIRASSVALRSLVACILLSHTTKYALSEPDVSQSTIE